VHLGHAIFLFAAATIAGALNAVAGGGGFIAFPALIFTGMQPISANATNTAALWPGTLASTGAYRGAMRGRVKTIVPLIISGIIGGTIGAYVLLHTPQRTFMRLVPWFLLSATLLFTFGRRITSFFRKHAASIHDRASSTVGGALIQLIIGLYIGYFGAGAGILVLAMLALLGETDIHAMNGMKTLLVTVANGMALLTFAISRTIMWPQALVMVLGAALGGYAAAWYAQKIDPRITRGLVIATGFSMAIYFFVRY
jgi:uncharacterized membrane protein YfcA